MEMREDGSGTTDRSNLCGDENSKKRQKKNVRRCCFISVIGAVCLVCLTGVIIGVGVGVASVTTRVVLPSDPEERAVALLKRYPLIDGLVSLEQCMSLCMERLENMYTSIMPVENYFHFPCDLIGEATKRGCFCSPNRITDLEITVG